MAHDDDGLDAGQAARRWIVRLASGEAGATEMRRLEQWLAADPAHRAAFERERAFWQGLGPLEADFAGNRGEAIGRPFRRGRWASAAGAALAACLALFVLWDDIWTSAVADYRSAVGEQRAVGLPDGSVVHLNTDTAIVLRFSDRERRVELLRGEALFEVAPDKEKPFRVAAAGGVARAVGTAFVVRVEDETARVLVTEGRVSVSSPDTADSASAVEVAAGERTAYRRGGAPKAAEKVERAAIAAWRRGKIAIDGLPLRQALAELDRYRPGRIVLMGDEGAGEPVSGIFDLGHVDEAVDALAATQGLTATRITPFLLVLR